MKATKDDSSKKVVARTVAVMLVLFAVVLWYYATHSPAALEDAAARAAVAQSGDGSGKPSPATPEAVPAADESNVVAGNGNVGTGAPVVNANQQGEANAPVVQVPTAAAPVEQAGEPDDVRAERVAQRGSGAAGAGTGELSAGSPAVSGPVAASPATSDPVTNRPVATMQVAGGQDLRMRAEREGSVNGCSGGELVLSASGLQFACPSDSAKSVTLGLAMIDRVDKSGVEANGHKYHFNIQDESAEQGEKLFRVWLEQARAR